MKQYSFLQESAVDNILATAGMAALGSQAGDVVGKHTGSMISKFKNRNLQADNISWTNPLFTSIVKKSLLEAQNKIKLAKEWYDSCDEEDKSRARMDYVAAVNHYKALQKDISDRRADRWIDEYKATMAVNSSEKAARIGRMVGGAGAFIGTAAKLARGK